MLLEFGCENYKSIKHPIILSMIATKNNDKKESVILKGAKEILPVVSIYGANGSGKTNIISAIGYMSFLISKSNDFEPGDELPCFPHKLSEKKESSFQLQFIANGVRFAYGFTLNSKEITEEYLYHFKNNKQANIFERSISEYNFGKKYKNQLVELKTKMHKDNKLFLPIAAVWSNFEDLINSYNYLKRNIVINQSIKDDNWLDYTLKSLEGNENNKASFITFLNNLGITISDLNVKINTSKVRYEDLPLGLPEEAKMLFTKAEHVQRDVKLQYNKLVVDLSEESRGIQKLFEIGGPILDVLRLGQTLVYDELETSLHPIIVKNIIGIFMNPQINTHSAQLIFTTHDTNLLDLSLFRKDQIFFVEKTQEDHASDIYALSDLKNIRKSEDIKSGYIRGKYGSIPFVNNYSITQWMGKKYE